MSNNLGQANVHDKSTKPGVHPQKIIEPIISDGEKGRKRNKTCKRISRDGGMNATCSNKMTADHGCSTPSRQTNSNRKWVAAALRTPWSPGLEPPFHPRRCRCFQGRRLLSDEGLYFPHLPAANHVLISGKRDQIWFNRSIGPKIISTTFDTSPPPAPHILRPGSRSKMVWPIMGIHSNRAGERMVRSEAPRLDDIQAERRLEKVLHLSWGDGAVDNGYGAEAFVARWQCAEIWNASPLNRSGMNRTTQWQWCVFNLKKNSWSC